MLDSFSSLFAWLDATVLSIIISIVVVAGGVVYIAIWPRMFLLMAKNLGRNKVRTALTCLATVVLVFMVTMIWTVIHFLGTVTEERSRDFKLIVTERWQVPSQMPMSHAQYLDPENGNFILDKNDVGPSDFMTWSFYGGTLAPNKFKPEDMVFFFAMNPKHIRPMMEDLQDFDPALVQELIDNPIACVLGKERLKAIDKKVGERFTLYSVNYKGIDLEFQIVGELPEGRYDKSGIMNIDYFNNSLDEYEKVKGQRHPLHEKRLNLIWLRVRDKETFERVGNTIENSPYFAARPVKCDTASSLVGSFLDAYRDLLSFVKWFLVPAILISMALVVANAISINVRERRAEMAVLKVLGFRPNQVLSLVLGESLLVGAASGFFSAGVAYVIINVLVGGIPLQIAFFPSFMVPWQAIFWGLAMGAGASMLGSFLPAYSARSVKVSEVFAKVA